MASRTVLPIIRRARRGDPVSQLRLGRLYLDGGEGLGANMNSALLWLDKAAEQGYADAWRLIGKRIAPQSCDNPSKLIRWYQMAANDGCERAKTKLARMLLSESRPGDQATRIERAIGLLRSAADEGHGMAQLELGALLLLDRPSDATQVAVAVNWLERAYQAGERNAARRLADHYWLAGATQLSRLWYSRCVELGDVELCYRFGLLSTLHGHAGERFLERAAKAGHRLACEELGLRYALGWRDESGGTVNNRNFKKAVRWLERAAFLGSTKACLLLSLLYNHENCSFRNHGKADEWMLEAANRGHPEAQYRTAKRLLRDLGSERLGGSRQGRAEDPDVTAVRFLIDAERQGHPQAARALNTAACRIAPPTGAEAAWWTNAVATMATINLPVAMRMELAGVMGMRLCEMMFVDPVDAHRGDCFVVDLHPVGIRSRRRVVLIEHQAQREVADRARSLFASADSTKEDLVGDYDSRYFRFERLWARAGIDCRPSNPDRSTKAPRLPLENAANAYDREAFNSTLRFTG
ncbi:MAG: hypothetical protein WC681_12415 [Sterolibacterium sp.]|jgi:hypothetical protein